MWLRSDGSVEKKGGVQTDRQRKLQLYIVDMTDVSHHYENMSHTAPSSTKLGHRGQTTREATGVRCSIVKLIRRSNGLLVLFELPKRLFFTGQ